MLHRLVRVYTCQNATLLEITCCGSIMFFKRFFILLLLIFVVYVSLLVVRVIVSWLIIFSDKYEEHQDDGDFGDYNLDFAE